MKKKTKKPIVVKKVTKVLLPPGSEFLDYLSMIGGVALSQVDWENNLTQGLANCLESVYQLHPENAAAFSKHMDDAANQAFTDVPEGKVARTILSGLEALHDALVAAGQYDEFGMLKCWISGYEQPRTVFLRPFGSKKKSDT